MARQLNATAASLLGFLHDGPMSGWDLSAHAQTKIGEFWSLTQSQVYRELARMADEGLVTAGERGTREKRLFEITETGRAAFAEWVADPPDAETIRFPLLLRLVFGRHVPGDRLQSFLAQHRMIHADRLAAYERQRREMPEGYADDDPYTVATLEFGLRYERAVLDWFDNLPPALSAES